MATNLDNILTNFKTLNEVSNNGLQLILLTQKTSTNIDTICSMFEDGTKSESWSNNMVTFAGVEGMELSSQIYTILKETQTKLKALGA